MLHKNENNPQNTDNGNKQIFLTLSSKTLCTLLILGSKRYLGNNNLLFQNGSGISVCEVAYKQEVSEDWHCHENMHFTLFLKGGTVEQRKHYTTLQTAGNLSFFRSFEPHLNYKTSFDSKNLNIEIESSFLEKWELTEAGVACFMKNTVKSKLLTLKIYAECLVNDTFTDDTLGMLLTQFSTDSVFFRKNSTPPWVGQLFDLLEDHWNQTLCLTDIAGILGIHPITLSKHFPRYFGCTYGEYVRRLKICHALRLIRQKISLTEIAFLCGFSDQSHFIRTFKHLTGFLPGRYKKVCV